MTVKTILTEPNKILRQISEPVDKVGKEEQKLMDDMLETMYAANGIGLAAIQIGIPKRIIVMDISKEENKKEPRYFVNPIIINKDKFLELKNKYPDIPNFFEPYNKIKIPAAWLIEKIGYKGKRFGNAGIHNKQALVIVNYGNAQGNDILMLANEIKEKVLIHFGIKLEFEVNLF